MCYHRPLLSALARDVGTGAPEPIARDGKSQGHKAQEHVDAPLLASGFVYNYLAAPYTE